MNNKQRRAAKARKRRMRGGAGPSGGSRRRGPHAARSGGSPEGDPLVVADLLLVAEVRRLSRRPLTDENALASARALRSGLGNLASLVLPAAIRDLLDRLLRDRESSWPPGELAEVVRRRLGEAHVATLAGVLAGHRLARRDPAWRAEAEALGAPRPLALQSLDGLADALRLATLLALLPPGAGGATAQASPPGPARSGSAEARRLATVRALLAKAEATPYDEEADALTAKAQELVTRYALERLLEADTGFGRDAGGGVTTKRIWLDPPYPAAKSALVHEVAHANRCRAVYSEPLALSTVVGDPVDVEAVELLVTSLLVQASRAMLRHGSQVDRGGVSRTRSFRHSFLVSFARRIGQRLHQAAETEVAAAGRAAQLLPALRSHEDRVDQAFTEMFPHLGLTPARVTNGEGWAAGQVAADLATLDAHAGIGQAAG